MQGRRTAPMTLAPVLLLAVLLLSACTPAASPGIDLLNNPSPDVRKETGPLTVPPPLARP